MSCTNNTSNINKTFIIEPTESLVTGNTISACTAVYTNNLLECENGININGILYVSGTTVEPITDNTITLGTPIKRFRDLNTISGTATLWSATTSVITPEIKLGLDTFNNIRTINANNSVIQDDCLNGGIY